MSEGERRRRRIRGTRGDVTPPAARREPPAPSDPTPRPPGFAHTADMYDDSRAHTPNLPLRAMASNPHEDRDDRDEHSLRGLIGGGSSQVSVRAAMRARDASRPSDDDIAAVESSLTIVHRGWVPRDP